MLAMVYNIYKWSPLSRKAQSIIDKFYSVILLDLMATGNFTDVT